jgi:hypothetical protein
MLHVLQLPMTKDILEKMTADERSFFLLLGYASNQVNALWKLVIIATNETPENPVEQRVTAAQTQIFVRLTIGAMHEAWLLVERGLLKTKAGRKWAESLDAEAQVHQRQGIGHERCSENSGRAEHRRAAHAVLCRNAGFAK